jgi:ribosome biogenesis GTPase / thiamine phosphate phosphatase
MPHPTRTPTEVIAVFGRHLLLRDESGNIIPARPMGRRQDIVCGDRVSIEQAADGATHVTAVLPRSSLLARSNQRGRGESFAANASQMGIVTAPMPVPDLFMVDRYLCAASSAGLAPLIIANKSDLAMDEELRSGFAVYRRLGYPVIEVCARDPQTLPPLQRILQPHTTVLVGQSGVGKSSIIKLIAHDADDAATGDLVRQEEGRHTTTASRLYECHGGGRVIDSPGVRDFAPAIDRLDPRSLGFTEVELLAAHCRFQDCRHMQEPGCAVRAGLESRQMDARRYESYRRLRRLFETLWERRPQGERAARRQ